MSEIYIAKPGGSEPISTDEEVLRTLWNQGLLSDDLMYWKQDMPDWANLSESLGAFPGDGFPAVTSAGLSSRDSNGCDVRMGVFPPEGRNNGKSGSAKRFPSWFGAGEAEAERDPPSTAAPADDPAVSAETSNSASGLSGGNGFSQGFPVHQALGILYYVGTLYYVLAGAVGAAGVLVAVMGMIGDMPWLIAGGLVGGSFGVLVCVAFGAGISTLVELVRNMGKPAATPLEPGDNQER